MLGSHLTGVGSSVLTGKGSANTATGVCAPAPGLFLTDGASFKTGTESLLTATEALPCGPSLDGIVYWFDATVASSITKNGSNQVSAWADQTHNHFDVLAQDEFRNPTGTTGWPVYTPGAISGLPALDWGTNNGSPFSVRFLQYIAPAGHPNLPLPPGTSRTCFGVCKPNRLSAGILVSFRLVATAWVLMYRTFSNTMQVGSDYVADSWFLGDSGGGHHIQPNFTNTPVLFCWEVTTSGGNFYINGVQQISFFNPAPFLPDNGGLAGFSLGYDNLDQYTGPWFSGLIGEEVCYQGIDATKRAAWTSYLKSKWSIT